MPLAKAMKIILIIQVFDCVELDQVSKQRRQLRDDFAQIDSCIW